MSSAFGKRKKSDGRDFYPTEPLFTEILCDKVKFNGIIWEPACGDHAILIPYSPAMSELRRLAEYLHAIDNMNNVRWWMFTPNLSIPLLR